MGNIQTRKWGDGFEVSQKLAKQSDTAKYLITADWHWDNPKCDRAMMKKHFDRAKKEGAAIISVGDQFCAMQGRYDPRRSRKGIRPEHDTSQYLDSLVDTMSDWLMPYKDNLAFVCDGNHEITIHRNCETNILGRVVQNLQDAGGICQRGAIGGWINLKTICGGTPISTLVAYHHGAGGGGPVTKGTIQTARRAAYRGQADIQLSGHIHEKWMVTLMQERVTNNGRVELAEQVHISLPTYKDEYDVKSSDYHMLNNRPPKPLGAFWMELRVARNSTGKKNINIEVTAIK